MSGLWWFKQQLKSVLCREYPLADRDIRISEWVLFEQPSVSFAFHCPTPVSDGFMPSESPLSEAHNFEYFKKYL
jgi:hypothetical protein